MEDNVEENVDVLLSPEEDDFSTPADSASLYKHKRMMPRLPRRDRPPDLEIEQILAWADAHYARTGKWPTVDSGRLSEDSGERWRNLDGVLRSGGRALPGGSSLARLLAERRGKRNHMGLPLLQVEQILEWADAHFAATGSWPSQHSGAVADAPGETWTAVELALSRGKRGLPGGSSLPRLLAEHRNRRHQRAHPLEEVRILAWADAHFAATGSWPHEHSGSVSGAPGETWGAIDQSLKHGLRGWSDPTSLRRLLADRRGARCYSPPPRLTEEQILAWADAHYARTGDWPTRTSGEIPEAPSDTWARINDALHAGARSLPGNSSIARMLAEHRGVRNYNAPPRLDVETILLWADRHYARHNRWPTCWSGKIDDVQDETWVAVDGAFKRGGRGLAACGYRSLTHLLDERRGKLRRRGNRPAERIPPDAP